VIGGRQKGRKVSRIEGSITGERHFPQRQRRTAGAVRRGMPKRARGDQYTTAP
jgi:hypothetical protein